MQKCKSAKMRKRQHKTNPKLNPNPSTNPNLILTLTQILTLTLLTGVFCMLSVVTLRIFALSYFITGRQLSVNLSSFGMIHRKLTQRMVNPPTDYGGQSTSYQHPYNRHSLSTIEVHDEIQRRNTLNSLCVHLTKQFDSTHFKIQNKARNFQASSMILG